HPVAVAVLADRGRFAHVVLVADLADDFLEDVLERDEPRRAAELVHHDRQMPGTALEVTELAIERLRLRHESRGPHQILPAGAGRPPRAARGAGRTVRECAAPAGARSPRARARPGPGGGATRRQ